MKLVELAPVPRSTLRMNSNARLIMPSRMAF